MSKKIIVLLVIFGLLLSSIGYTIGIGASPNFLDYYLDQSTADYSYKICTDNNGWYWAVNGSDGRVVNEWASTNAATVIQNTVNTMGTGELLKIMSGSAYNITATINLKSSISIEGEALTIWNNVSYPATQIYNSGSLSKLFNLNACTFVSIKNLMFVSDNSTTDTAIDFGAGATQINIDNCIFERFNIGVNVPSDGYCTKITNNIFDRIRGLDICVNSTSFNWCNIEGNIINQGIYVEGGSGSAISRNCFDGKTKVGIYPLTLNASTLGWVIEKNRIELKVDSADVSAFYIDGDDITILGGQSFVTYATSTKSAIQIGSSASSINVDESSMDLTGYSSLISYSLPSSKASTPQTVYDHTSGSVALLDYASGTIHTNLGQSGGLIEFYARNTTKGKTYTVSILASETIRVWADTNGQFYYNGAVQPVANFMYSSTIGSSITIVCDGNGKWFITSFVGTWGCTS